MIQVLLVDDEQYSLEGVQNLVPWERWKCRIVAAVDNAAEALEIIRSSHIDIIFTDIRMPEMDGLQLIKTVKTLNPAIEFVIISGYGEFDYARRAMQYGVKDYLLKPVGITEIEEVLLRITEHYISHNDDGQQESAGKIDIETAPVIKELLLAVTRKDWNSIGKILLEVFKQISERGGSAEDSRRNAIRLLSLLVDKEIIYSNESTLMLAGRIGSADTQSVIFQILKEQILLTQNQGPKLISEKLNPHIQKILIHLITHYRDKKLTLKWISENVVYVKSDYLGKLFYQETGKSFAVYLAEYRITRACEHLRNNPDIPIHDVSEITGYYDNVSYFIRQFKKLKGVTPSEYATSSVVD